MGRMLYLECQSGIAGDMLAGALIDLGANTDEVSNAIESLDCSEISINVSRIAKSGVPCVDFDVVLGEGFENHDHDMAYLYGHLDTVGPTIEQAHNHDASPSHHGSGFEHIHTGHAHEHGHEHGHGSEHEHGHRRLADVLAIVDKAALSPRARDIAKRTFEILADGEAAAHGTTREEVFLHEVGALDSIADIVACSVCLDNLDVDRVVVCELVEGTGTVRCAHGVLPIPVPAVTQIARANNLTLSIGHVRGELVTPTGAALAAAIRTDTTLPKRFTIKRVGVGAGKRQYPDSPQVLRAMLIEPHVAESTHNICKLECDIDDSTGEALGAAASALLAQGAYEVHFIPLFTKKFRPAWQLQVICEPELVPQMEAIIFSETTTIGIRKQAMERSVLDRELLTIDTTLGPMRAKRVVLPDGLSRTYPEHDAVVATAQQLGISYQDAYRAGIEACLRLDAQE